LGVVVGFEDGELIVDVRAPIAERDGLGFEPPAGGHLETTGFSAGAVRTLHVRDGVHRQAIRARHRVPIGWRVIRNSHVELLERARATFADVGRDGRRRRTGVSVRVFGAAGGPLKAIFEAAGEEVTVRGVVALAPAERRALDEAQLREQFGRLGETPFVLGELDARGLAPGLFVPVSELNRLRQEAVDELLVRRDWARQALEAERDAAIDAAIADVTRNDGARADARGAAVASLAAAGAAAPARARLVAESYALADLDRALEAGADEVVLDPFLRHPFPPVARVAALADRARAVGRTFRLRLPTIVRPEERKRLDKWLALGTPLLSGHLGLLAELAGQGRDVVADYATNCFNQHTARELLALGASAVTPSVELTTDEIADVVAPWAGEGFEVLAYGRPEGMTIEHCVLSAAFDRTPTHCRDLCTKSHVNVELTDPAGYRFPVATDYACRNRLLHSRPVEASEFLPRLHRVGVRRYRAVFNVPGDDVAGIVAGYRALLDDLDAGRRPSRAVRDLVGERFTRGHFARAV
jgi:putative protease